MAEIQEFGLQTFSEKICFALLATSGSAYVLLYHVSRSGFTYKFKEEFGLQTFSEKIYFALLATSGPSVIGGHAVYLQMMIPRVP